MAMASVYDYAKYYVEHGLSVIPLKPRSKEPAIRWKKYQEEPPSQEELKKWFEGRKTNIAIVTGRVSGNLVVLDFDSKESFKAFIEKLRNASQVLRIDINNTWVVETSKGYHLYLRLPRGDLVPHTKIRLTEGIDIKAEGGYVVAPPSIHPSGKQYKFIKVEREILGPPSIPEPIELTEEEWQELLSLLVPPREKPQETKRTIRLRELGDNELLKLKEILKDAWIEGQRQFLALFMSGWFAKAKIHPISAAKLFRLLAEERGDNELEERLSTIYYSYKKVYGNILELKELDSLIEKWRTKSILKRNVSKAVAKDLEERVKGRTGVQELLENTLGEERALEAIRKIEEIMGVASPFRDTIYELLDYEKQLYAAANLRKLVLARVRRIEDKIVYKERVAPVAPTKVVVYENPLGGIRKYEVIFEGATLTKPLHIGPAYIEDIVARLKAEGLVYNSRLIGDVLNAVIQGYIRKDKAEIREEIEFPGFYLVNGKIVAVRWKPEEASAGELRIALELLDELATKWFSHVQERFATVIKWYLIAPFSYIYKQKRRWIPWLYLYGPPDTGKSTQSKIGASIWGLSLIEKPGSATNTTARLERILSSGTFPVMIKEPAEMFANEAVVEMAKSAVEDVIARGKIVRGSYVEIPALAPIAFTSNKYIPREPGLTKRLLILVYSYSERIPREKQEMFKKNVEPRLAKLKSLGYWVARRILEHPGLLEKDWLSLAEELLEEAYQVVELDKPKWVGLRYEAKEDVYEELRENIREFLIERINTVYFRAVGKVFVKTTEGDHYELKNPIDLGIRERVKIVLEKGLVPWAYVKGDYVILTTGFANELNKIVGDIGGLKSIAELLGWEYKRSLKLRKRVVQAIVIPLIEFVDFLI